MKLFTALQIEWVKLRRTVAIKIAILAPLGLIFLQLIMIQQRRNFYARQLTTKAWEDLINGSFMMWALLMLPLVATLQTALLAGIEHQNKQWKNIFAQELSPGYTYGAKQLTGVLLLFISLLILSLSLPIAGTILRLFAPGIGFELPIPLMGLFVRPLIVLIGSLFLIALQNHLALEWPSFAGACGVGVTMTVLGMLVINSRAAILYPWTIAGVVSNSFSKGESIMTGLIVSLAGWIGVNALGLYRFSRREILD